MKTSIYCKYRKDYSNQVNKLFEKVNQLEKEIKNTNIDISNIDILLGPLKDSAIFEFKREIIMYLKYDNGSMGADKFLIRNILFELLIYIFILKEKKLLEEEKETCATEIENRFYFLLNLVYNYTEKIKEFCNISENNNKIKISIEETIFNVAIIKDVEELFKNYFDKIKDYLIARSIIAHHLYRLEYNKIKNEIKISESRFNLTKKNLYIKKNKKILFKLNFEILITLVEGLHEFHKKIIELLLKEDSIDLKKLVYKFYDGKGVYKF